MIRGSTYVALALQLSHRHLRCRVLLLLLLALIGLIASTGLSPLLLLFVLLVGWIKSVIAQYIRGIHQRLRILVVSQGELLL